MSDVTLVFTDEAMLAHDPGGGHAEHPGRLRAVLDLLEGAPVAGVRWSVPRPASRVAVERIHDAAYIDALERLRGGRASLDADTAVSPGSVEAAWLAAGAAVDAATAVVQGRARRAFAIVRPPGHHAEAGRAMGFCLFNNVAIAAAHALEELGCRRVLVVDWDVHHGNGTQHAFESRSDVLVFDVHRDRFYPETGDAQDVGRGGGEGFQVNVPLSAGMGDADYALVFREVLVSIAEQFRPDLVLVSAGFDAHRDDLLGDMSLTDEGYAHLCGVLRSIADAYADGRLVMVLEGGYDTAALARSVRACVGVLAGDAPPEPDDAPSESARRAVAQVRDIQRAYWKL